MWNALMKGKSRSATSLIFISHSHRDRAFAQAVKHALKSSLGSNVDFFMSSDADSLAAGVEFNNELRNAIAKSAVILVLITESSIGSQWVFFESGAAWVLGKKIIPVHVADDVRDRMTVLSSLQAIDFRKVRDVQRLVSTLSDSTNSPISGHDWTALSELVLAAVAPSKVDDSQIDENKVRPSENQSTSSMMNKVQNERRDQVLFRMKQAQDRANAAGARESQIAAKDIIEGIAQACRNRLRRGEKISDPDKLRQSLYIDGGMCIDYNYAVELLSTHNAGAEMLKMDDLSGFSSNVYADELLKRCESAISYIERSG